MVVCLSGDSLFFVLRIIYDELVVYVDDLDKKEEYKNFKKKYYGKCEENEFKFVKEFGKKDIIDVSKNILFKKEEVECKESNFIYCKDKEV